MGKRAKNNSKRIKTSHKKGIVKRKTAYAHVDRNLLDVNHFIDNAINTNTKQNNTADAHPKIEAESISTEDLKKILGLLSSESGKKRLTKLSVDDVNYLEPLIKKYGDNYERAAKDIKLNRMQWTANQIAKKYESYNAMIEEENAQQ